MTSTMNFQLAKCSYSNLIKEEWIEKHFQERVWQLYFLVFTQTLKFFSIQLWGGGQDPTHLSHGLTPKSCTHLAVQRILTFCTQHALTLPVRFICHLPQLSISSPMIPIWANQPCDCFTPQWNVIFVTGTIQREGTIFGGKTKNQYEGQLDMTRKVPGQYYKCYYLRTDFSQLAWSESIEPQWPNIFSYWNWKRLSCKSEDFHF